METEQGRAVSPPPPTAVVAPPTAAAEPRAGPGAAAKGGKAGGSRRRTPTGDQDALAIDKCIVHVNGFPPYTQPEDLSHIFAKFGPAKVDKMNSRYAYITFQTEDEAKAAIQASKKVNIYGEFLVVRPYNGKQEIKQPLTPKRDFPMSKQKGSIVDPLNIDLSGDFHQQVDRILAAVRLTQEEATAISTLYADVERVLQAQWPGCTAMPFGSITTGLGIKSSDADCYMHIPPKFHNANSNFVMKAKRILQAYPQIFAEILSIPRANTPIVKFFHIPTETNCDLSFKTPLGAQNSKLIAFLLHSDPRLLPMAVVIKYWAKVHGLSGTGKLTNYALTLLIIFYLQQAPLTILPSVEWLQRDPKNDVIVDFWSTGFMDNRELLPPSTNKSSLSELLGGFYEFYSTFNFEEMVVCPFLGNPIKKMAFRDLPGLPEEFKRYKENVSQGIVMHMRFLSPLCVQDPFEQSHNVASAITSRFAVDVKAYFKFAAVAYEKEKPKNCDEFLKTILLQKPKIVKSKMHPEFRITLYPRMIAHITNPDWKPVVRQVVFKIFEGILKLKLGKIEEKVNTEMKKEKEKYTSTLTKPIWKRKQFNKLYGVMRLEFLEKQMKITEEIIRIDKNLMDLPFQVVLTFAHDPKSAVVSIKLLNGDPEPFREFGKFYISIVQNWFMFLIKPFTKPITNNTTKAEDTRKLHDELDSDDELDEAVTIINDPECDSDKDDTASNSKDASNSDDTDDAVE